MVNSPICAALRNYCYVGERPAGCSACMTVGRPRQTSEASQTRGTLDQRKQRSLDLPSNCKLAGSHIVSRFPGGEGSDDDRCRRLTSVVRARRDHAVVRRECHSCRERSQRGVGGDRCYRRLLILTEPAPSCRQLVRRGDWVAPDSSSCQAKRRQPRNLRPTALRFLLREPFPR